MLSFVAFDAQMSVCYHPKGEKWHRAAFSSWRQCHGLWPWKKILFAREDLWKFVVFFCRCGLTSPWCCPRLRCPFASAACRRSCWRCECARLQRQELCAGGTCIYKRKINKQINKSKLAPLFTGRLFIHRLFFEQGSRTWGKNQW